MGTKATITLFETEQEDNKIIESMTIDYEVDKDADGNVILRSNVIGISRVIFELFKFGILDRMTAAFIPAPKPPEPVTATDEVQPDNVS
jgi:hypothetical protein